MTGRGEGLKRALIGVASVAVREVVGQLASLNMVLQLRPLFFEA